MPEPNKRIIVEGVNFAQLFQFQRILRATTAALQPARMVIGLLMVTALITFGQIWDSAIQPSAVSPQGLSGGVWSAESHAATHQQTLRQAMTSYAANNTGAGDGTVDLKTSEVLRALRDDYESRRAALATDEERRRHDEQFATLMQDIERSRPRGIFEATRMHTASSLRLIVESTLAFNITGALTGLQQLSVVLPVTLWQHHKWFTIIFGAIVIIVFAIGGGAIARSTALQMAVQQRLGVRESIDFSLRRLGSFVMAQALPLLVLLALCAAVVVLGVLMAAPVLDVLGGLLYGLALLLGFLIAFVIIGFLVGQLLLVPAVACENCGGPDAMQRAYAYVVTRPLHLLGYWFIALIGLALGFLLVSVFALLMLNVTASLYGTWNTNPAMTVAGGHELFNLSRLTPQAVPGNWHHRTAASLIGFWETVVISLVGAYVLSYYFSASTVVYLLIRRAADGQDTEEIWQQSAAELTPTQPM